MLKINSKWTKIEQDAFDKIKWIVACNTLITYTDFNENFKTNTDASNFKLGAFIIHKAKPIALYSRKRTEAQQMNTVTERELLSIIETMK